MRDLVTLARRLFETRRTVKELERQADATHELNTLDASRLLVFRGALQALAWALEIDLEQLSAPPLTNLPEQPSSVTLHRVELGGANGSERRLLWLTEIPAHHDPVDAGFSTEYWSCFLNGAQARELHAALGEALGEVLGEALGSEDTDTKTPTCALPRLRLQPRQPAHQVGHQPAGPDVADLGYAYTSVPRPPHNGPQNGQRGA